MENIGTEVPETGNGLGDTEGKKRTKKSQVEEAPVSVHPQTRIELMTVQKSALMMDRMSQEMIEKILVRKGRPPPVTDQSLRAMCEQKLYSDEENKYGIPVEAFYAALREAGRKVKVGKSGISTADTTTLFSFLQVEEEFLRFPEDCQTWEPDLRRGQMDNAGKKTAAGIIRPKFKKWGFTAHLNIDYGALEGLTPKHVRDLVTIAGQRIGLLAFRPTCNGPFGCYRIESWDEQEVKAD